MSDLADPTIARLRTQHDLLVSRVADLSAEQLAAQSGAAEWSVAQVLSHLGSGAEINAEALRAAAEGDAPAGEEFVHGVWARWDALEPREQAAGFLEQDEAFVAALEALDPEQRETVRVALGWMPQPVTVSAFAGLRLSEAGLHGWDALVGLDPSAEVDPDLAALMMEHYASDLAMLVGFLAKDAAFGERVVLDLAGTGFALTVDGDSGGAHVAAVTADVTAVVEGPPGSAARLLAGRLRTPYDDGVAVSGNVTLDALRAVFTGY